MEKKKEIKGYEDYNSENVLNDIENSD